jgi:hypothetical protein
VSAKSKQLWIWGSLVLACSLIALADVYLIWPQFLSLPQPSEIEYLDAEIVELNQQVVSFRVQPDHYSDILSSLVPANRDGIPAD